MPFQGGSTGSNPVGDTTRKQLLTRQTARTKPAPHPAAALRTPPGHTTGLTLPKLTIEAAPSTAQQCLPGHPRVTTAASIRHGDSEHHQVTGVLEAKPGRGLVPAHLRDSRPSCMVCGRPGVTRLFPRTCGCRLRDAHAQCENT